MGASPEPDWAALKVRARAVLAEVAGARSLITYGDLAGRLGGELPLEEGRDLASLLRELSTEEDEAGRGLLSAVVVRAGGEGLPGGGFFRLAESRGRDVGDRRAAWRAEVERVWRAFPPRAG